MTMTMTVSWAFVLEWLRHHVLTNLECRTKLKDFSDTRYAAYHNVVYTSRL